MLVRLLLFSLPRLSKLTPSCAQLFRFPRLSLLFRHYSPPMSLCSFQFVLNTASRLYIPARTNYHVFEKQATGSVQQAKKRVGQQVSVEGEGCYVRWGVTQEQPPVLSRLRGLRYEDWSNVEMFALFGGRHQSATSPSRAR